jgi:WD40 repeat protein
LQTYKCTYVQAGVVQLVWPTLQQSLIATGATDGVVRIWDCRSGAQVARWVSRPSTHDITLGA